MANTSDLIGVATTGIAGMTAIKVAGMIPGQRRKQKRRKKTKRKKGRY